MVRLQERFWIIEVDEWKLKADKLKLKVQVIYHEKN